MIGEQRFEIGRHAVKRYDHFEVEVAARAVPVDGVEAGVLRRRFAQIQ